MSDLIGNDSTVTKNVSQCEFSHRTATRTQATRSKAACTAVNFWALFSSKFWTRLIHRMLSLCWDNFFWSLSLGDSVFFTDTGKCHACSLQFSSSQELSEYQQPPWSLLAWPNFKQKRRCSWLKYVLERLFRKHRLNHSQTRWIFLKWRFVFFVCFCAARYFRGNQQKFMAPPFKTDAWTAGQCG